MVFILPALPLALLATSVAAAPLSRKSKVGNFKVSAPQSKRNLPSVTNPNGTFNKEALQSHIAATKAKYTATNEAAKKHGGAQAAKRAYEANKARALAKRASGNDPLTDDFEDGVDDYYYGAIEIGTPAQDLTVDFDTGSSDLWLPGSDLGTTGYYDASASSTFQNTSTPFEITYGSGNVAGTVATDTVTIADLTVDNQTLAVANTVSSDFQGSKYTGLLGLAFSAIAQTGAPTFFENLVQAGQLDSNLFAFSLARGGADGSELSFGATDSSKYTGDISSTPVTSQTYWEVQLEKPVVSGSAVGSAFPGAIDTGTTLIYVPTAVASAIWEAAGGSADTADGEGVYKYDCSSSPDIALTFDGLDGQTFAINPDDLNLGTTSDGSCVGAILGQDFTDANGEDLAIVGDVFLKSWYSVYDYDTPAVGFAAAA